MPNLEPIFAKVAADYGLDKHRLAEQGWRESRWNPLAVGRSNDMGVMQLLPATWDGWAPRLGLSDPFDAESNIRVGAAYLVYLRNYVEGRLKLTGFQWSLVAYNWGIGNVTRLIQAGKPWSDIPAIRQDYAINILLGGETRALAAAEPLPA